MDRSRKLVLLRGPFSRDFFAVSSVKSAFEYLRSVRTFCGASPCNGASRIWLPSSPCAHCASLGYRRRRTRTFASWAFPSQPLPIRPRVLAAREKRARTPASSNAALGSRSPCGNARIPRKSRSEPRVANTAYRTRAAYRRETRRRRKLDNEPSRISHRHGRSDRDITFPTRDIFCLLIHLGIERALGLAKSQIFGCFFRGF